MCPDPQLISLYVDGELPSPWKEKLESHLAECPGCRKKFESFSRLFGDKDALHEQELMETAKTKVWQNLQSLPPAAARERTFRRYDPWHRRVSIPLPAAAAAAVILVILAALLLRSQPVEPDEKVNMILASEEALPGIIPADMNSVLQYLGSDGADIIILRLPESRSFISSGEPAIIKAADYPRRHP